MRSRTAWVLLRVSLEVATSSYPRCGAEDHLDESVEMCGLPSYRLLPAPFCECCGRVATRWRGASSPIPGPLELRSLHRLHEQHKLRGSYGHIGKLKTRCFAPGSLPAHFVARPRRLCTRKGRRAHLLSVVICSGTRHRRALRALTASHQSHRSNYGTKRDAAHDHSPSYGRGPAPGTTFKKTDPSQSHGDRQHSKAHHPF